MIKKQEKLLDDIGSFLSDLAYTTTYNEEYIQSEIERITKNPNLTNLIINLIEIVKDSY